MRAVSFFSGIGGFDLGLERAGMEIVFQSEINKFCQQVLKKHWPNVPINTDIKSLELNEIPEADLWCGGFPCQDLSLANQGKRKGLDGERSGLFYKFSNLVEGRRPKWIILENVPGLLNSNEGQDFKILTETLDELGYGLAWRVLDAKYFGTPQRRRRVFIVGSYGNSSACEVLFEQGATRISDKQGVGAREIVAGRHDAGDEYTDVYAIQHASIGRKPEAGPQAKGYRGDGETYTLDSRGSSDAICSQNDPFRIRETPGVPQALDSNRFRALGNAVAVPIVEWIGRRIMEINSRDF